VLTRAGYRTGGFSANALYVTREYGLGRGFVHFEEERSVRGETVRHSTILRAIATSERFREVTGFSGDLGRAIASMEHRSLVKWLSRGGRRPYFAFVNFMDAHAPYLPPAPYDTMFGWYDNKTSPAEKGRQRMLAHRMPSQLPRDDARHLQHAYEGAIAALDAATGDMLDDLEQRGLLENTIVIIAADHGEEFGEHGVFAHGNSLYLQSLHVPLVIRFPGRVPGNVRVRSTISLKDVAATILDLIGVRAGLPGESLRRVWESPTDSSSVVLAEVRYAKGLDPTAPVRRGDMASAINDPLQLIRDGTGAEEVFDLRLDPEGAVVARPSETSLSRLRDALPPAKPKNP